jgi:hypothetical protein
MMYLIGFHVSSVSKPSRIDNTESKAKHCKRCVVVIVFSCSWKALLG